MPEQERSRTEEERNASQDERDTHHPTPGGLRGMV